MFWPKMLPPSSQKRLFPKRVAGVKEPPAVTSVFGLRCYLHRRENVVGGRVIGVCDTQGVRS